MHKIEIPQWAIERGRSMNRFDTIEPEKTALLVIDMQNWFIVPGQAFANANTLETVPNINKLASTLRAGGGHVMWSRQAVVAEGPGRPPAWIQNNPQGPNADSRIHLKPGAFGHALYEGLDIAREDTVFDKYRYSAFCNAAIDVDQHLRSRGIDTVIVTGTVTNCCCESTARDAMMRDYKVLFATDATSAVTDEEHNAALLNVQIAIADVRDTAEILSLLEQRR